MLHLVIVVVDARSDVRGNYKIGNATMKLIDTSDSTQIVGPVYVPRDTSIYYIRRGCSETLCSFEIRRYQYAKNVLSTVLSAETDNAGTKDAFNSKISAITYSSADHKIYFVTDNSATGSPNLLLHSFDLASASLQKENNGQSICQNVVLSASGKQHSAAGCNMDWTMGHNNIAARCDGKIYIQQTRFAL